MLLEFPVRIQETFQVHFHDDFKMKTNLISNVVTVVAGGEDETSIDDDSCKFPHVM